MAGPGSSAGNGCEAKGWTQQRGRESPSKMQGGLGSCPSSLIAVEMSELPEKAQVNFNFQSWSVDSLLIANSISTSSSILIGL